MIMMENKIPLGLRKIIVVSQMAFNRKLFKFINPKKNGE